MAFQKSTTQLKNDVLTRCGELTDGSSQFESDVVLYLNKVYQNLLAGGNLFDPSANEAWVWAQSKNPILFSLAPTVTGTATLTNGSTAGTFGSTPTLSLEGRYLFISGQSDVYKISQHTAASTSFSIDQEYLETTGSYNYTATKLDYDMFSNTIIINSKNNKIDFTEGGGELTATLTSGSYTPAALCTEIDTRMTAAGSQSYTVSFNSITRKFTIAQGGASFSLLFGTGTNAGISASATLGYDCNNYTGALTYSSEYALSAIMRITKPISIYRNGVNYSGNPKDSNKIFLIDDNTFMRECPINRMSQAIPDKFCVIEQNPDGLTSIRVNSYVDENVRCELGYIPVHRALFDNANSFPIVPSPFSDFLVYGAAHFIMIDKSDSKADVFRQMAQAELKALIADNRKGISNSGQNQGRIIPRPSQVRSGFDWGDYY